MRLLFMTISVLLTFATARAQDSLEQVLAGVIEEYDIPAMAALTIHGDQIVEMAAVGVRVRGGDKKVTLQDKWHLGSCTKAMTATLVAFYQKAVLSILEDAEEGSLRWQTCKLIRS